MEREQEEAKQKEIDALQNQLQQLKDMAAGKTVKHSLYFLSPRLPPQFSLPLS